MTGQENDRPNELIEHAPVTLRRFRLPGVDRVEIVPPSPPARPPSRRAPASAWSGA